MLSSKINPDNGDSDGETTMPGGYEPWPRPATRTAPPSTSAPSRPIVSPAAQPRRRSPITQPNTTRLPTERLTSPVRPRRRRRRSLTPDIVVDRRSRHRRSSGRQRVIRISLDNRPTLGLRGPPQRVVELERVRCRRRRRRRSSCYEVDYDTPPPPPPPQPNIIIANPIPNPCLPPAPSSFMGSNGNAAATLGFLSNLTPEMIENLPKQIVHLPPIHLPGSQADATTELNTVIFPAELINPVDGTLSIIQAVSPPHGGENGIIPSRMSASAQPQSINASPNDPPLMSYLSMASGPFLQQLQDLFQRINLSQAQSTMPSSNRATIQPPLPFMPQSNRTTNSPPNLQPTPRANAINTGSYPPANIRPTNTPNTGSFNPTNSTPSNPVNITPYSPANITPYRPPNITSFQSSPMTPVRPPNTTPYSPTNVTTFQPNRAAPSRLPSGSPYRPANITPFNSTPNRSVGSSTSPPFASSGAAPYAPPSSIGSVGSQSMGFGDDSLDISNPPQSQTPYRPNNPVPKSILRNGSSNAQMNTTYTRLNPSNVSSPRDIVRKTATFV